MYESSDDVDFGLIRPWIAVLADLERLKTDVSTFSRIIMIYVQSFLYLQVTRTCMKSKTSSKFGQIRLPTAE